MTAALPLKKQRPGHCPICGKGYSTSPHGTTVTTRNKLIVAGVCGPRLTGKILKGALR